MTSVDGNAMPSDCNYTRQNTSDSCVSDGKSDTVVVTVNGSAHHVESNSPSNSLDRSLCSSLGADEMLASCISRDDYSTSVADPDEQALLEKLQHANRFVSLC